MSFQAPRQAVMRSRAGASAGAPATGLAIPFDYVARFHLTGRAGNVIEQVITTDVDGQFVAEVISYGFEPRPRAPITAGRDNARTTSFAPERVTLAQIGAANLVRGVRVAADALDAAFPPDPSVDPEFQRQLRWADRLAVSYRSNLLEPGESRRDFSFMFSMIDSATGRELQDEPTHSLASLGSAHGRRPFRRLAQSMTFQPRSTLRLQITELSSGREGTLFIVLQGHKRLQIGTCPDRVRTALVAYQQLQRGAIPDARIIPFDYVAPVDLRGERGRTEVVEVPVNVEGGFVATHIGYGLQPPERDVTVTPARVDNSGKERARAGLPEPAANVPPGINPLSTVNWNLAELEIGDFPADAWLDGIRIRPDMMRLALQDNGRLASALQADVVDRLFERMNLPEEVSFTYGIHDTGTGRDLQNRPVHSVAGLGSADGHRPFRQFTRPLVLMPNSALRVTIQELRGRGRLFIAFHGFKVLGSTPTTVDVGQVARRSAARRR